jgi:predicted porin
MYTFGSVGSLTEIYTEYKLLPGLSARLGQFKTPYTIENLLSPTSVELINCYSQSTNYLAGVDNSDKLFGGSGGRDMGLMFYGDLFDKLVDYKLALMNGQGINIKDQNKNKDIVGSLMVNPLKWLSIGSSFIKGKGSAVAVSNVNSNIAVGESYTRNRWSVGAVIETNPVSLRSEYLSGKDGAIESDGFYTMLSYHFLPKKFDVIASYDYINRDKLSDYKQTNYIAGVQYWFYPRCRLQLQYTFRDEKAGEDTGLIQAQIQVRF